MHFRSFGHGDNCSCCPDHRPNHSCCVLGLSAFEALRSSMRPVSVTYQRGSSKSYKHTGDAFPLQIKLWDPTLEIQLYFAQNSVRLGSILLQGRDPRPGNTSFLILLGTLPLPMSSEHIASFPQCLSDEEDEQMVKGETTTLIPAFDDSVSKVINAVLRAEGRPERMGRWAMPGNIIPDFMVAVPNDDNYSSSVLPGEAEVRIKMLTNMFFYLSETSYLYISSQLPDVLDGVTSESDISKLFTEYQSAKAPSDSSQSQASEPKPRNLFDSVLPQILGYMTNGVS